MAVDLAVVGLQKRPISSIVPKVRIVEVLDCVLLAPVVFAVAVVFVVVALAMVALGAVITALTAAIFASNFGALSRHFFFWERLPCPGPGMLSTKTEGDSSELVLDFEAGSVVLVPWLVLVLCDL
jgi:hypothetical protein